MRRTDLLIKIMSAVIFLALALYIGYYYYQSKADPLKTASAVYVTVEDSVRTEGYIVREEEYITGNGSNVTVSALDGAKVAAGEPVAVKYNSQSNMQTASEIRRLTLRIEQLEKSDPNRAVEEANNSVLNLAKSVYYGELQDIDSVAVEIEAFVFTDGQSGTSESVRAEIASMKERLRSLQSANPGTTEITAPYSGLFCSAVDRYEGISPEDVIGVTPSAYARLFENRPEGQDGIIGKLISGLNWYYAAVMDSEDAERLHQGKTAQLSFSKSYTEDMDMTVESIGPEENGRRVVVFSCSRAMQDTVYLREMTADVVFSQCTGLRIPKQAMHLDGDGRTYIYLRIGVRAKLEYVEVVGSSGDNYIVMPTDGGEIHEGSEVIVKANDLYDGKVIE